MKDSSSNRLVHRSAFGAIKRSRLVPGGFFVLALLLLTLAVQDFRAQEKPPEQTPAQPQGQSQPELKRPQEGQPKIAVEVKTVSVLATVRDKHGKIISNYSSDHFQLDDDGCPQTINYFAHESDMRRLLGLLADTQPRAS